MAPMTTFIPCVVATNRYHVPVLGSSTMLGRPLFRLATPTRVTRRVHCPLLMTDQPNESSTTLPPPTEDEAVPAPEAPIAEVASEETDAAPSVDPPTEASIDKDTTVTATVDDTASSADAPQATEAEESKASSAESDQEDPDQPRRRRRTRTKRKVTHQLEDLTIGQELSGTVRGVTTYGAFIGDLGTATDGLLHVSQLAAGYIENVSDVVSIGDKVTVRVFAVDIEKRTFSLTMKTAEELAAKNSQKEGSGGGGGRQSPMERKEEQKKKWDDFTFDQLTFLDGKVLSITEFGAFCQLLNAEGQRDSSVPTDGLIHISEISDQRVEKVSDVLSVDEKVRVRIVSIDRKRNRISLSLKDYTEKKENSGSGPSIYKRERKEDFGGSTDVVGDLARAMESQPSFKTSFELAFDKARTDK